MHGQHMIAQTIIHG